MTGKASAKPLPVALLPLWLLVLWIRLIPGWLLEPVTWVLALLLRVVTPREIARAQSNIQRIYGLPPGTHFARQFMRQLLHHQIICALETVQAIYAPSLLKVTGLEELRTQLLAALGPASQQKGCVLLTGHLGSWELCAYYGQLASDRRFHVLAKPARQAAVTALLEAFRERMGTSVLWTAKKTLLRDMLGALKRNEMLGFVMDQKPEARQGPVVDFFGIPTAFVSGPATMVRRTGCGAVSIFCVREGLRRYRIVARALVPAGHSETDELQLTARFAAEIERVVRAYPEQWAWNYKRWPD